MNPRTTPQTNLGRPRNDAIDEAVPQAVRSLIAAHGYAGLSMQQIAAAAGTTRQALYRRWPNKARLVLDALFSVTTETEYPDLGDLRAEMRIAVTALAGEFNDPIARSTVSGLLGDLYDDPELHSEVRARVLEPDHARVRTIFERAAARGELAAGFDQTTAIEAMGGAIVYRTCFLGLEVDDTYIDSVVDLVVRSTKERH